MIFFTLARSSSKLLAISIVLFCLLHGTVYSQNTTGKDFWLAQTPNAVSAAITNAGFSISVSNVGTSPANISITNSKRQTVNAVILPNSLQMFTFTTENDNIQSTGIYKDNVYHVTSDKLVVVNSYTPLVNVISNDGALILPTPSLGKKYIVASYVSSQASANGPTGYASLNSFFAIVANQNGTNVKAYNTAGILIDNVNLNAGEYYQRLNGTSPGDDVTGYYIETTKPVSVFSGSQATAVGNSPSAQDHLDEQILPIETLANTYLAAPSNTRPINCTTCSEDIFRYVATEDNTVITTSPNVGGGIINKGQYIEIFSSTPHVVTGTKPFYGYQYLTSQRSGSTTGVQGLTGDPALIGMPVVDQFQYNYNFAVPNTFNYNFINVVCPTGTQLSLDDTVRNLSWKTVGTVNGVTYVTANIKTYPGAHTIVGDKKFAFYASSFSQAASIAYLGGSGLEPINAGCITGGPYQYVTCTSGSKTIQLNGTATCSDGSRPSLIRWTSSDGVVFSNPNIANPTATVPGFGIYSITMSVTCDTTTISCTSEIIVKEPIGGCASFPLPTIKAPPAIIVPADTLVAYATNINLGTPVYTSTGFSTLSNTALTQYPLGSTIVTWTVTDALGRSATDTQRVIVVPPPTIVAPPAITRSNDAGEAYATIGNIGTANYTSAYGPDILTSDAPANQQYPLGTTTVTWTIKDGFNRTASATQLVTVTSTPPTIVAPPAITVSAGYNGLASITTLGNASYTVSVNDATVTNTATANKTDYAPGVYTITWTVTDGLGRIASDNQVITVLAPLPVIAPPADVTVNNNQGQPYATGVATGTPTFSAVGPYTLTNNAPTQFPLGETIVTWTLTDVYGVTVTTTNKVTVVSALPTIVAPATINIVADYNGFATITNLGTATTTVSVDPATVTSAPNTTQFAIGTTFINWTVTDGIGRTAGDVQKVVVSVPAPVINPPADITISNDQGKPYSTKLVLVDPAFQAVGPYTLKNDAPAQFPLGETIVTWTLTDAYGNTTTTTNKVTVVSAAPTLVPPADITVTAASGQTSATISNIGTATYTVGVDPAILSKNAPANNVYPVGTTTITWTVKDGLGRTASGTQTITVKPSPVCNFATSIVSIPTDNTPTGGNPKNLYIGYGAQSTKLQVNVPNTGGPYTFQWTGTGLNNTTSAAPIFTPGTTAGNYTFTVAAKNANGCTSTSTISICVRDVRSLDKKGNWDGKKVIVCHLPPGNPANVQYIDISINAVPTHVPNHGGDGLGNSCVQASCNSPYARGVAPAAETFAVNLYPNPTANQFSLTVKSDDKFTDINIRIIDAFGRTVEVMKGVTAGRTLLFGEKYANGAYYAEVVQGSDKKIIPMVKAN